MLDELLQGVEVRSLVGDGTVAVGRLEFDSRKVVPGTLFFATRGTQADGHAYIPAAVAAGAAVVPQATRAKTMTRARIRARIFFM